MNEVSASYSTTALRGCRLALHVLYGMWLAILYPLLSHARQRRTLKAWSRTTLDILNIGIQLEGQQPARDESGCLMVANHVSWLDIFVLNAIHPARFIAKSEVRSWPLIGWLCKRTGTIFIERAMRQDAASVNLRVGTLLKQGVSIGLFPEGTSTDGLQVGHFHSALIQPAIDAGVRLCPVAMRYQDAAGALSTAAAFTGDTTLARSIWRVLRCQHLNALLTFTPALDTANGNRRVLARAAQAAVAQALKNAAPVQQKLEQQPLSSLPQTLLSARSAYVLLLDPVINQLPK